MYKPEEIADLYASELKTARYAVTHSRHSVTRGVNAPNVTTSSDVHQEIADPQYYRNQAQSYGLPV